METDRRLCGTGKKQAGESRDSGYAERLPPDGAGGSAGGSEGS